MDYCVFQLTATDRVLLSWVADKLGCGQDDAVRACVSFAADALLGDGADDDNSGCCVCNYGDELVDELLYQLEVKDEQIASLLRIVESSHGACGSDAPPMRGLPTVKIVSMPPCADKPGGASNLPSP